MKILPISTVVLGLALGCSAKTAQEVSSTGGASSSACPEGSERCACYGNSTCDTGFECRSGLCVSGAAIGGSSAGPSSSCATGSERCACYGNSTCDTNLECMSDICAAISGSGGAGVGGALNIGGALSTSASSAGGGIAVGGAAPASGGSVNSPSGGLSSQGGLSATSSGVLVSGGATTTSSGGAGNTPSTGTSVGGATVVDPMPQACPGLFVDSGLADADSGTCQGVSVEVESTPIDMYFMLDRTMSMAYCLDGRHADECPATPADPSRWQVLQQGLIQFLNDSDTVAKKPRLGLGFFGATGNPDDPTECLAATYAQPTLPIGDFDTVSSKAQDTIQIYGENYLGGQTPWQPSLHGALQYAQAWQKDNPLHTTVVVFVTDGYPTECGTDMNGVLETAGEYFTGVQGQYNTVGQPGIRTYLVGVGRDVAENAYNLNMLAQAAGTGTARLLNSSTAEGDFAQALSNIVDSKIDCNIALPPPPVGTALDPGIIRVVYNPFGGSAQEIPMAASAADCDNSGNGGWYYDDATNPTQLILCPCSCANLGAGSIKLTYGCSGGPLIE